MGHLATILPEQETKGKKQNLLGIDNFKE